MERVRGFRHFFVAVLDESTPLPVALTPAEVEELLSRSLACPSPDSPAFLSALRKLMLAKDGSENCVSSADR